ncbi:PREDICTED: RCC1 and BTB domain-containing protein 1-like [Cyphomyrmex costatus]|uniref:RCC1 and BTB domain-containing protein 1-like n=1 Tax=Cyphomyrmex costatus TaxID=456900 RepID=UPI0008521F8D|nr:PREDICTED: RCC1 and BTB domain-containing protein 1-like [Cyphomyrmex costatus]
MCTSDLRNWHIVSTLESEFVSRIHMVMVYGENGKNALIVTRDKMVYALGANTKGCLGTGNKDATLHPKKIEVLCTKDVKTFACSYNHVLALTKGGEVYSWGYNFYSQVRKGLALTVVTPTLVNIPIPKRIIDIACGFNHSIALTEFGELYFWGVHKYKHKFTKFTILAGKKIVYISCGGAFTIVVIENGEVYGWGINFSGQLGVGDTNNRTTPCQLNSLKNIVIVKVACGYMHTLALTDEGDLYVWGENSCGQLGTGNQRNWYEPVVIEHQMGRVLDIAASYCHDISIAIGKEGRLYVWGYCHGQTVMTPIVTPFSDVHNAIASYATSNIMHKPLILNGNEELGILKCLKTAFDDHLTSDLKIQVENQIIHVHKAILKIRSFYFKMMFQHVWSEKNQSVIQHDEYSYKVYKAFLNYLYTDVIGLPWEQTVELFILANDYCEDSLKKKCIRILMQGITISNVTYLYTIAVKYKEEELEEFCIKFAVNHFTVVALTENFAKLDQNMMKTLIIKTSEAGGFKM